MFDVFYSGVKPGLFAHEQAAETIEQARELASTRYFWWINYLTDYAGFDFLFEPVPWQALQRHAWPSQWQRDSGTYLVPRQGSTDTNYHTDCRLLTRPAQDNWTDTQDTWDYTWHPDYSEPAFVYQFGTQWQKTGGPRYCVPGATDVKYVDYPRYTTAQIGPYWDNLNYIGFDYTWHPDATDPPMIYQFGTQHQRTGGPRYVVPGATQVNYVRTVYYNKTVVDNNWVIPATVDADSFDFTWHPDATDPPYRYQFGTQHQRTGGPEYCVPGAVDTKYIDQIRIKTSRVATAIIEIDHMDGNSGQIASTNKIVRYFDNYLDTLKRIANGITDEHEFVWICSSICDYTEFDFTWHPEVWQATMLHVFPSDGEKFGDTFFMHVPTFKLRAEKLQLLDWYDLNFMDKNVPRRSLPIVQHSYDTHVEAVKNLDFKGPLAIFTIQDDQEYTTPAIPLWREKTKTIVPLSNGASVCIVPKASVAYIKKQLYDYPNILRTQRHMFKDDVLDIVFIDNGESNADDNYNALCQITKNNKVHRSSGVNGRVSAYQAAARLSTTPWFFAVFAKLQVDTEFNWAWQPDRLQEAKHYIFHARNPVNGLTYGHQALIAYNKKLVLANTGQGLDFTLDSAHEVVPILSGTANYTDSKWSAWRTAFRECIKLKCNQDVESQYRLDKWLTESQDYIPNAEYSRYGAEDAVEYYASVAGDFAELKKSYDWAWLASYAFMRRGLITDQ
jgi:hypothetical protein